MWAAFAAQSLTSALSSVQFVTNVICVVTVHKQSVAPRVILSTVLIIAGNVMLVIFASKETKFYTIEELQSLWIRLPYVIYLGISAASACCSYPSCRAVYRWKLC